MKRSLAGTLIAFSVAPETTPGLAQPHVRLEAFDRRREARVPREAARLRGVEIALDRQPLAQFRHRRTLGSRADRDDVGRPAAGVDDRRIAFGRLGGGEEGVGLERRLRIVAERGFARRRGRGDLLRLRRRGRDRRESARPRAADRPASPQPRSARRRDVRRRHEWVGRQARKGARTGGGRNARGSRACGRPSRLRRRAGDKKRRPTSAPATRIPTSSKRTRPRSIARSRGATHRLISHCNGF